MHVSVGCHDVILCAPFGLGSCAGAAIAALLARQGPLGLPRQRARGPAGGPRPPGVEGASAARCPGPLQHAVQALEQPGGPRRTAADGEAAARLRRAAGGPGGHHPGLRRRCLDGAAEFFGRLWDPCEVLESRASNPNGAMAVRRTTSQCPSAGARKERAACLPHVLWVPRWLVVHRSVPLPTQARGIEDAPAQGCDPRSGFSRAVWMTRTDGTAAVSVQLSMHGVGADSEHQPTGETGSRSETWRWFCEQISRWNAGSFRVSGSEIEASTLEQFLDLEHGGAVYRRLALNTLSQVGCLDWTAPCPPQEHRLKTYGSASGQRFTRVCSQGEEEDR